VDFAIVEVGLGGTYDSTNVITPVLSIITNVSMDHMNYLGDKIEDIARNKAGIIKDGVPVITGCTDIPLMVVEAQAKQCQAACYSLGKSIHYQSVCCDMEKQVLNWCMGVLQLNNITLSLVGAHQQKNASLAIAAAKLLHLSDDVVYQSLAQVSWSCRWILFLKSLWF
jgi:dihydrofolate synthase/folylpolyglutamate synthase